MIKYHRPIYAILIGALCVSLAACVSENAKTTPKPIPVIATATQPGVAATDSVLFEWQGVPVMPGALSGEQTEVGDYSFITSVSSEDLIAYYEEHMPELGWKERSDIDTGSDYTIITFQNSTNMAYIRIQTLETNIQVTIHVIGVHGSG